jgi:lipopolysaccharide transport system ATP-binding protein
MSQPAIRVENLSKRYRINTLRSEFPLLESLRSLGRRTMRRGSEPTGLFNDYIWALRNLSFEVQPGEVWGIIGKNGSGKSTLLKLLSRIIRPTEGRIMVRGRVASLLEVGTGFHPELSGRENVHLNAAILGMSRAEIRRKFDEIVAFSEVGGFIDTPIKRYSSGMRTRLAFAVAAHLEPDILIIDEVLSVGDANFQQKSLGKMDQISEEGRTVLFVSHNMAAVSSLCPRSMLLSDGIKVMEGSTADVIRHYMQSGAISEGEIIWEDPQDAPGGENVRLYAIRVVQNSKTTNQVDIGQDFTIQIEYDVLKEGSKVIPGFLLMDRLGTSVLSSGNFTSANIGEDPWFDQPLPQGHYSAACTIPGEFLNEGPYKIRVFLVASFGRLHARFLDGLNFNVYETGAMRQDSFAGQWSGVVRPRLKWRTEALNEPIHEGQSE